MLGADGRRRNTLSHVVDLEAVTVFCEFCFSRHVIDLLMVTVSSIVGVGRGMLERSGGKVEEGRKVKGQMSRVKVKGHIAP